MKEFHLIVSSPDGHILDDEAASRAYIQQVWAEAMEIYQSGDFRLILSDDMNRELLEMQKLFMPEDTKAGMIQTYLDAYPGSQVCSKQLYTEALHHAFEEPKQWEIREINEIMNNCIDGWKQFPNPRMFDVYGKQRGWERVRGNAHTETDDEIEDVFGAQERTEGEQLEIPF